MIQTAIKQGYNFGVDFAQIVSREAETAHDPDDGVFDLFDVDMHNYPIEQDCSLSRIDAYFGNATIFDAATFKRTLSYFGSDKYTNFTTIGRAHYAAVSHSRANNPEYLYDARQYVASYIRDATGIAAMSDPYSGRAKVVWYKYWIENERFPTELGWAPSAREIDLATLTAMAANIAAATPQDTAPHGVQITLQTVTDVLSLIDPITGIVANNTVPSADGD